MELTSQTIYALSFIIPLFVMLLIFIFVPDNIGLGGIFLLGAIVGIITHLVISKIAVDKLKDELTTAIENNKQIVCKNFVIKQPQIEGLKLLDKEREMMYNIDECYVKKNTN